MGLYGASDKDGRFYRRNEKAIHFFILFFHLFVWADDLFVSGFFFSSLPPMHTDFFWLCYFSSVLP